MVLGRLYTQQGFALPIALMLGLMFMVMGASVLVRSNSDNTTAAAQRVTLQGLNAAEIGVGRFQSLMNQNRGIAKYPAFGASQSWQNATAIPTRSTSCTGNSATTVTTVAISPTKWMPVDPSDVSKGQYRLFSYTYDAAQKQGILIVDGQVGSDQNPSVTRLEVKIPVVATSESVPGLWVKDSLPAGIGTMNANIWGPCTGNFIAPDKGNFTMERTTLEMPDFPSSPAITALTMTPETLPQPGDTPVNGIYQYVVPNISDNLTLTPGKKVSIWVQGDIVLQDGQAIQHSCGTVPNCSPWDVKIYGTNANGTVEINDNASVCEVMVWAPTYKVEIKGNGNTQNCGAGSNNNSIYWVKTWTGGGHGKNAALDQTYATWNDAPIQPISKISPIASWRREQMN